ncbi:CUB and zona pellucida-like domain-containing protein 1 [Larimichthys crocea]|uniref:CUB and zona pellucida-like domain-containing protein 1 n=1 Tax=Larimichthys crocea TaxID=215358 RepID=A0A0F8C6Q5_LARCR|nr:CUB and zona pellucida-like domain-containing protein 1 [Larimichthys crocea]
MISFTVSVLLWTALTVTCDKPRVICDESKMTVEVNKDSLKGLRENHLRLNDPTCRLETHSNSTHVIAVVPLSGCGTLVEEDEDNFIFKNEITTRVDRGTAVITRKHRAEILFFCQYPKRGEVSLAFLANRDNIVVEEKGYGTFTYEFVLFKEEYKKVIDPNLYPVDYEVTERIYMQIAATSSVNNTVLFVESCKATPSSNINSRPAYSIIENGCSKDSTLKHHSHSDLKKYRFSMEAFKFIGSYDQVYISCLVMMCERGNRKTRCALGCIESQRGRVKREAVAQTSRHRIYQGPIRLKRSAGSTGGPVMNLNLVFIAGCLLAAVGVVSAAAAYKAKLSRVKYQPLPAFEYHTKTAL